MASKKYSDNPLICTAQILRDEIRNAEKWPFRKEGARKLLTLLMSHQKWFVDYDRAVKRKVSGAREAYAQLLENERVIFDIIEKWAQQSERYEERYEERAKR